MDIASDILICNCIWLQNMFPVFAVRVFLLLSTQSASAVGMTCFRIIFFLHTLFITNVMSVARLANHLAPSLSCRPIQIGKNFYYSKYLNKVENDASEILCV